MYGILISFATIVCLLLAENIAKKQNMDINTFWRLSFWTMVWGLVGARLYHVVDYHQYYFENPMRILMIYKGGLGIFGGIIGGILTLSILSNWKARSWLNIASTVLPLGQAIGRWGNYFNNELISTFMFESILDLILFLWLYKKSRISNNIWFYLLGYGTIRIALEPLRVRPSLNTFIISSLMITTSIVYLLHESNHGIRSRRIYTQRKNKENVVENTHSI